MRKQVLYGNEARTKILDGIKKIAAAVKVTLGPSGRNVLISQSMVVDYGVHSLPINVTKDGYHTTKAFDLDEPFEKAGVLLVKESAQKTVDEAGDGTTSTVVLLEGMAVRGMDAVAKGGNPIQIKREMDKAVEYVVNELKALAIPVKGNIEKIRQIATVSANNDPEIGDWIAQAFERIGSEGIIDLEPSKGINNDIKIADGYKWDKGWCSPYFINIPEKQICEFIDPVILLYEKKINHHSQIQKILESVIPPGKPILIICEDVVDEGLAFLGLNTIQGRIKCCVVKSPAFGESRREEMEDLALLTGGTYLSDTKGIGLKDVKRDDLGTAKKVIVSKDETIIIGGNTKKQELENLLNELRMNLTQVKSEDEKAPIEKRIARLTGGVAVIQVGAATETEMKEKLDRFDDAVRATKAAISEGYVPGAATAFLRIKFPKEAPESRSGYDVVFEAFDDLLLQICSNAGVDGQPIVDTVIEEKGNVGYNAKTGKIEDLVESGIIDPAKVLRCALQNASSSAGMFLTTECLIADTL